MPCALGSFWEGQGWSPDHPELIAPFPHSWSELSEQLTSTLCQFVQCIEILQNLF